MSVGTGLVGEPTVKVMSHAVATIINKERNIKAFLITVTFIVNLLSRYMIPIGHRKLPCREGSFHCPVG
jgi:hypothetical protein